MVRIEGYVSKTIIRRWLQDYHEFGRRGRELSETKGVAPTTSDGWGGSKINKIMLDQALDSIPDPLTKYCAFARWVHVIRKDKVIKTLEASGRPMTDHRYKKYCDEAVDFIYRKINGNRVGMKELVTLITEQ